MKRPIIRQSTISKTLFPFMKREYTDTAYEELARKRMQKGVEQHEKIQQWLSSFYGGESESTIIFDTFDLLVQGHVDHGFNSVNCEFKFTNKDTYHLYDSYIFQIAFYLGAGGKPLLYYMLDQSSDSGRIAKIQPSDSGLEIIIEELNRLFTLYMWKLVIDDKATDGRYDVEEELEEFQFEVFASIEKLRRIIWNSMIEPTHEEFQVFNQYSEMNGWTLRRMLR